MTRRFSFLIVASFSILALVLSIGTAAPSSAQASFTVNSTADAVDAAPGDGACATLSGRCTLRAAVQETNALPGADSISVPAGTYVLAIAGALENASTTGDLDITDGLTLTGSGARRTIIDGARQDRVLHVADALVQVSGVTVRNGLVSADLHGGGIFNSGSLTVSESVISGNAANWDAGFGGGIFNVGTTTVAKSEVRGNSSLLLGGLGNVNTLVVLESTVSGNITKGAAQFLSGAGIGQLSGSATVIDSTISKNSTSADDGGAGGIGALGNLTVRRSTISDNFAGGLAGFGGGIAHANGTLDIADSTISGNTTAGLGGGLSPGGPLMRLTNVTISNNKAAMDGGGIAGCCGEFQLNNVTITNNTADSDGDGTGDGGGIGHAGDLLTISNTIIAGNVDGGGEQPDCNRNSPIVSQGYNLIGNTAGCPYVPGAGDITGRDPMLGGLANNGGPTQTHALLRGSPAIDAGNPAAPSGNPTCEPADQRGAPRPQDGDGDGIARCDIGAFERDRLGAIRR